MLGEQRISAMMEYKEVHEIIFRRQCEHKMMDMQIEDQKNMARNVWKLKLFEEEKDVSVASMFIYIYTYSIYVFSSLLLFFYPNITIYE